MISINRKIEKTSKAWMWRALLGPAMILDGICSTVSLGTVSMGFALEIARILAKERYNSTQKN